MVCAASSVGEVTSYRPGSERRTARYRTIRALPACPPARQRLAAWRM